MSATFKIEQFSLPSFLLCIDAAQATGSCLIKGQRNIGSINFNQGAVVYVGVESASVRLGERLVDEKFISAEQMRSVLQLQQRTKPWKSLGTLCLEAGLLNPLSLQLAVHRHMVALLDELLTWDKGIYKFEYGSVSLSDAISLSLFDYLNYRAHAQPQTPLEFTHESSSRSLWQQSSLMLAAQLLPFKQDFFQTNVAQFNHWMQAYQLGKLTVAQQRRLPVPLFADLLQTLLADMAPNYLLLLQSMENYQALKLPQLDADRHFTLPAAHFDIGHAGSLLHDDAQSLTYVPLPLLSVPNLAVAWQAPAGDTTQHTSSTPVLTEDVNQVMQRLRSGINAIQIALLFK